MCNALPILHLLVLNSHILSVTFPGHRGRPQWLPALNPWYKILYAWPWHSVQVWWWRDVMGYWEFQAPGGDRAFQSPP